MRNNRLNSNLDEVDRTILRLLQENGTLSNAKLAERLSLSVTRVMPGVTSIHSSLALREIKSSSRLPVY